VRVWQIALRCVAAWNLTLFAVIAATRAPATPYGTAQRVLCGIFVAVCAFRSCFPVVYAARFCLVDAWPSNVVLGRSAAMLAELCFASQLALLLDGLGEAAGSPAVVHGSYALLPLNVAAQLCCWYGIATRRSLGELCEEALWFLMVGIVFASFVRLATLVGVGPVIALGLAGTGAYLSFMALSVLPMYVRRSRHELAHPDHLSLAEGLRSMASDRVPTGRWEDWGPEVAWMSLYFSLWTWLSMAMAVIDPATAL
jgi:hypothetical protein